MVLTPTGTPISNPTLIPLEICGPLMTGLNASIIQSHSYTPPQCWHDKEKKNKKKKTQLMLRFQVASEPERRIAGYS